MESLDINEAAKFLKCGATTLQRKAKAGEVPARKIGKKWVFIREHLADYVSGRNNQSLEGLRVIDGGLSTQENKKWQSINKKIQITGTSTSLTQTASEYANLLGLKTSSKRKNSMTV